jgi:hypothetical protein
LFRRPKLALSCSAEGKEGRKENKLYQAVMLLLRIREVSFETPEGTLIILTGFRGLPQSLQQNSGIVPYVTLRTATSNITSNDSLPTYHFKKSY